LASQKFALSVYRATTAITLCAPSKPRRRVNNMSWQAPRSPDPQKYENRRSLISCRKPLVCATQDR